MQRNATTATPRLRRSGARTTKERPWATRMHFPYPTIPILILHFRCGLYYKLHGAVRTISMKSDVIRKPSRRYTRRGGSPPRKWRHREPRRQPPRVPSSGARQAQRLRAQLPVPRGVPRRAALR
jgi:hypothetical protein